VEPLRGAEIRIPHNERLPINDRQFYHFDLIGLSVHTVAGIRVGKIVEILENPGNDVWVIRDDNDRERLIPAIDSVIKAVRLEQRQVIIAPMPGLLDDLSDETIE
jgi:16S rRNA processing protein RimM